jgi:hypothetical protein
MFNLPCNIEANERVTRIVIGAVLFLAALLGLGRIFLFLVGIVLIAEGIIGWCGIPILSEKFKLADMLKKKDPSA